MSTVSTLTFLLGTWDVARTIEDHKLGTCGSFVGTAVLCEIPADCRVIRRQASYTELGVLRFGTHQGEARRLLELRQPNESTVMFFFADGRPFTDLDLSTGANHGGGLVLLDDSRALKVISRNQLVPVVDGRVSECLQLMEVDGTASLACRGSARNLAELKPDVGARARGDKAPGQALDGDGLGSSVEEPPVRLEEALSNLRFPAGV